MGKYIPDADPFIIQFRNIFPEIIIQCEFAPFKQLKNTYCNKLFGIRSQVKAGMRCQCLSGPDICYAIGFFKYYFTIFCIENGTIKPMGLV